MTIKQSDDDFIKVCVCFSVTLNHSKAPLKTDNLEGISSQFCLDSISQCALNQQRKSVAIIALKNISFSREKASSH